MLIGLHGRKQAGKDTVYERARHLMADVLPVERASFADLLYASAAASLGLTFEELRRLKTEPLARVRVVAPPPRGLISELTIREFLQRYGTEAHRDIFGDDFWVDHVRLEHAGKLVLVTDVRFANEARAVREAGGWIVRVVGPPGVEDSGDGHASETPLPAGLVDLTLYNERRDDGFAALDVHLAATLRYVLAEDGA